MAAVTAGHKNNIHSSSIGVCLANILGRGESLKHWHMCSHTVERSNLRAKAMLVERNLMENPSVNRTLKPNYDSANIHTGYSSIKVFKCNQQILIQSLFLLQLGRHQKQSKGSPFLDYRTPVKMTSRCLWEMSPNYFGAQMNEVLWSGNIVVK